MSVPQRAHAGKSPSTKITRQDVADLFTQIRQLLDAFERRLKHTPASAPSPSAMRSQLPRRSVKSAPRRHASAPRAFGQGSRPSASPGCCSGCYADNCAGAGHCTCACHGGR